MKKLLILGLLSAVVALLLSTVVFAFDELSPLPPCPNPDPNATPLPHIELPLPKDASELDPVPTKDAPILPPL